MMSVRITFRASTTDELPTDAGKFRQKQFDNLALASAWIEIHIPDVERRLVKMWVNDIPITGATLEASLRPIPPLSVA
jgi:hypothetical protein